MRTPCCHTFVAFILKFLNFLQAFLGVAVIIYSAYMLNQWQHHHDEFPAPAPSPSGVGIQLPGDVIDELKVASGVVSIDSSALRIDFNSLPAPWFIYAFMGIGILVCCITFIGHVAAEAINGCCLCFYALLTTLFVLLEVGLVAFVALDRHWEKDLPFDQTGELYSLRTFVEGNVDVFEWVGSAIVAIQALSVLFAIILRSLVSSRKEDENLEEDKDIRNRTWEPLLNPYSRQASGSTRGDSDIWSSRMREKYGLNGGSAKHNSLSQNPPNDV